MNRVLITGATGFIGQVLVSYLLSKNYPVRVLVRDEAKAKQILPKTVELVVGSLEQNQALIHAVQGVDMVFHLAGHAHAFNEHDASFAKMHHQVNFEGTKSLIDAAIMANVSCFIYFSTVKAVADHDVCIDESFTTLPTTPYGLAKRQAEDYLLAQRDKMHVCVLRPALVYGSGVKGNLASMIKAIDRGYFPPLPEIHNRRSFVEVHDLCTAALLCATNKAANGKVYFVTDGEVYSTRALYNKMRQALGKSQINWAIPYALLKVLAQLGNGIGAILKRRFPFDEQALKKLLGSAEYSSKKIQQELGFQAKYHFDDGLVDIVKRYRLEKE